MDNKWQDTKTALAFIAPALLLVLLLIVYPFFYNLWLSTNEFSFFSGEYVFRGLKNYQELFKTPLFKQVALNSFYWVVGSLTGQLVLGIFAALLLNREIKGRAIFRALLLVPWILPGVVAASTWKWLYDSSFGILNQILMSIGLISAPVRWLSDPQLVLWSLVIVNVWRMFPFVMLMVLAGLQAIPGELEEAAAIDGANWLRRLRHIILPMLRPVLVTVSLLLIIWGLNSFDTIYIITKGGPAHASEIFAMLIYNLGFIQYKFGTASAVAVTLFIFSAIIASIYIRVSFRGEEI